MNKLRKIIVEIDGTETEYDSISECAKALGVSVAAVSQSASSGWLCRGYVVRYADGTRRRRKRKKTNKPRVVAKPQVAANPQVAAKPQVEAKPKSTAEDLTKLIAEWYTKEWKEYVSSDALVSLIEYIKGHWN